MTQEERNLNEEFKSKIAEHRKKRELREAYEEDRDEQFEDMYYKLTCERCGEEVLGTVLAKDFDGSIIRLASVFDKVIAHNMTHYVPLNTE